MNSRRPMPIVVTLPIGWQRRRGSKHRYHASLSECAKSTALAADFSASSVIFAYGSLRHLVRRSHLVAFRGNAKVARPSQIGRP